MNSDSLSSYAGYPSSSHPINTTSTHSSQTSDSLIPFAGRKVTNYPVGEDFDSTGCPFTDPTESFAPGRPLSDYLIDKATSFGTWIVNNRCGLARLASARLISAQYRFLISSEGHLPFKCEAIINSACNAQHDDGFKTEKVLLSYGDTTISGIICYPPHWDPGTPSPLVVFNNMNGNTVSNFFRNDRLAITPEGQEDGDSFETPGDIQQALGCPILLYDYSGTGFNREEGLLQYAPTATGETVVKDAMTALHSALKLSTSGDVIFIGSSMGGGVATVALEQYLSESGSEKAQAVQQRIKLVNHDSYSTTSRVMLPYPSLREFADSLGWLVGAHIDAVMPMKKLIERNVDITILSREGDTVIPPGARMCEEITPKDLKDRNIRMYHSPLLTGHSSLSSDQKAYLIKAVNNQPYEHHR